MVDLDVPRTDNPFRPGAGHTPPYLAGREREVRDFEADFLPQTVVLKNLILTGLRGVGKTVLLERFKPAAVREGWMWVGTDLSESASLNEDRIALRLLTDLSVASSTIVTGSSEQLSIGFDAQASVTQHRMSFDALLSIYGNTPGLIEDKLKEVLETVWGHLGPRKKRGVIFAYDEAQNLGDLDDRDQFPLSLLLDVFQAVQRKGMPFMLVLTGLPTLFPKLVEARTFAERMFRVMFLDRLSPEASRQAIDRPLAGGPLRFEAEAVEEIASLSGGYPYFLQFISREVFDIARQSIESGPIGHVPGDAIMRKLDADFFFGRWARATDRQRELLYVAATLESAAEEFTVQEIVERSRALLIKRFSPSHANQMLAALAERSLIYKNRHGKYAFAVPLLDAFILRQNPPEGARAEAAP